MKTPFHSTHRLLKNPLRVAAVALVAGSLFVSMACGAGVTAALTQAAAISVVNLSADPTINGAYSTGTTVNATPIAYGTRSCFAIQYTRSSNLGDFIVSHPATGATELTDKTGVVIGGTPAPSQVYVVYGPVTSMKDIIVDLNGGTGGDISLWVCDASISNTTNYQVSILDKTTSTTNQVSPVSGVDGSRLQLEGALPAGHDFTLSLKSGTTTFKSVDFSTTASGVDNILVTLSDTPLASTQDLKLFHLESTTVCTN